MKPLRASWIAALLDGLIAAIAILVTYRLRFDIEALPTFLPAAMRIAPFAAVLVPLTLALCRMYGRRQHLWPVRLMIGAALGMALTALTSALLFGVAGVSRFAFVGAAVLTVLVGGLWRAAEGLRDISRRSDAVPGALEERGRTAPSIGLSLMRLLGYRELLRNLVLRDLKLKYRRSTLGFVWSLANPLLMLSVYSIAFTQILGLRRPAFIFFLLIGLLAWTFYSSTLNMATHSIVDSGGLLKSVRFPRAVLPLSTVLFHLIQYLMTFAVLLPVMLVMFGVAPSWAMVGYPLALLLFVLFTIGSALLVSASAAYFRDVRHLVEVALSVLFWTTPIIYDLREVPEHLRLPILLSPLSAFITAFHDIFYQRAWPDASVWIVALAWSAAIFVGGVTLFLVLEDRFAEQV